MSAIPISNLTQATIDGNGVFDVLMKANKAHLEAEFAKNRIKGTEYSTVYLGSLTQVMQTALAFVLAQSKTDLENQLLQKQIEVAEQQRLNLIQENLNLGAQKLQIEAQTALLVQQKSNLVVEADNIPKQGIVLDKQALQIAQQTANLTAEAANIPKQGLLIDANKAQVTQQTANLVSQKAQVEAQTTLVTQQKENAIVEGTVLVAQECKLRAEYDLTMESKLKTAQETALLTQKVVTERAQVTSMGVDADSVVGRQKALYVAQTNGFTRDAEQKAAKLLVDSWNVRRTTDEGTVADSTNMLNDATVGRAVTKLLAGVGA
jgi:hypothetical protein